MLDPASSRPGRSVLPGGCSVYADRASGTVTVGGEIDHATAPHFTVASIWLLATGSHDLTVSLRDVTFADSALVTALENLQHAARACGRELRIIDLPPQVARVMRLAGAADVLLA